LAAELSDIYYRFQILRENVQVMNLTDSGSLSKDRLNLSTSLRPESLHWMSIYSKKLHYEHYGLISSKFLKKEREMKVLKWLPPSQMPALGNMTFRVKVLPPYDLCYVYEIVSKSELVLRLTSLKEHRIISVSLISLRSTTLMKVLVVGWRLYVNFSSCAVCDG
jgi:hypothetical protein